jgi:hypothetical protein
MAKSGTLVDIYVHDGCILEKILTNLPGKSLTDSAPNDTILEKEGAP